MQKVGAGGGGAVVVVAAAAAAVIAAVAIAVVVVVNVYMYLDKCRSHTKQSRQKVTNNIIEATDDSSILVISSRTRPIIKFIDTIFSTVSITLFIFGLSRGSICLVPTDNDECDDDSSDAVQQHAIFPHDD